MTLRHQIMPSDYITLPLAHSGNPDTMLRACIMLVTCRYSGKNGDLSINHLRKLGSLIEQAGGLEEFQAVSSEVFGRGISLPEMEGLIRVAELTKPKEKRAAYLELCEELDMLSRVPTKLESTKSAVTSINRGRTSNVHPTIM